MRMQGFAAAVFLLIPCLAMAAGASDKPWVTKVTPDVCVITGTVSDANGNSGGTLEINWRRDRSYLLTVALSKDAPPGRWQIVTMGKGTSREVVDGKDKFLYIMHGVDRLKSDLAAG